MAGNVLGSDHLSLTKRTLGQWRRRTRAGALEPFGMQTNSWNHLWAGGRRGPRGAGGPRGTLPGVEQLLLQSPTNRMRLSTDGSRVIDSSLDSLCGFGQRIKPIDKLTKGAAE